MKLELFDNTTGFKPAGKVLDYWKFLPQSQTDSSVPSLYGNLKSMFIPYLMVAILVLCEAGLFYILNEDGVGFLTLLALSIFDFVIAILPAVIFIYGNLILSVINAKIFITETNLKISNTIPSRFNGNLGAYHIHLKEELNQYKAQKRNHYIVEFVLSLAIVGLAAWKFVSIYEVFGDDIFIISAGRFVMVVLILSIITHLFFTKIVFAHMIFISGLNSQRKLFNKVGDYSISNSDKDKMKQITYKAEYNPEHSGNQFIGEKLLDEDIEKYKGKAEIKTIEYSNGTTEYFAIKRIADKNNANIVYTGLLTEPELISLAAAQPEAASRQAILATGKQIQLEQN